MLSDSSWIRGPRRCLARDTFVLRLLQRAGAASNNSCVRSGSCWPYLRTRRTVRCIAANFPSISDCCADTWWPKFKMGKPVRGRPFNSWGEGMVFLSDQTFFYFQQKTKLFFFSLIKSKQIFPRGGRDKLFFPGHNSTATIMLSCKFLFHRS